MLLWSYKIVPMDGAPYKFAKKTGRGWEWGGGGGEGGEVNSIDPLIHI